MGLYRGHWTRTLGLLLGSTCFKLILQSDRTDQHQPSGAGLKKEKKSVFSIVLISRFVKSDLSRQAGTPKITANRQMWINETLLWCVEHVAERRWALSGPAVETRQPTEWRAEASGQSCQQINYLPSLFTHWTQEPSTHVACSVVRPDAKCPVRSDSVIIIIWSHYLNYWAFSLAKKRLINPLCTTCTATMSSNIYVFFQIINLVLRLFSFC